MQPAPEADRRTLARRVSLDLTGLPPTPEEVEKFVNDSSPDAYEKYVDRLLASPRWGEHRGRYWLDAARYADSNGIHFDNYREIWSFRDWVINAFNRNMPFDQFTIEQLAGDLLPDRTLDQQIASGFNRCNITTNEGGAIPEEYLVLYARDRTETTSQVWLGLTAGCAVCHDHKFDPLSQKEFYQLSAFFNNTTQAGMDGNVKDTPPVIFVPRPEDRDHWKIVSAELPTVRKELEDRKKTARADFDKWVAGASAEKIAAMVPTDGLQLEARLSEGSGKTITMTVDGQEVSLDANSGIAWGRGPRRRPVFQEPGRRGDRGRRGGRFRQQPALHGRRLGQADQGRPVRRGHRPDDDEHGYRGWDLWIENGRVGAHLINAWDNDAMKVLSKSTIKPGEWNHLMVTYDGSSKAEGLKIYVNGVMQPTQVMVDQLKSTTRTNVPLKIAQRNKSSRLDGALIQDVRIYGRALSAARGGAVGQSDAGGVARHQVGRQAHDQGNRRTVRLVAHRRR